MSVAMACEKQKVDVKNISIFWSLITKKIYNNSLLKLAYKDLRKIQQLQ